MEKLKKKHRNKCNGKGQCGYDLIVAREINSNSHDQTNSMYIYICTIYNMCTKEWRRKEQQPKTISIAIIVIIATHKNKGLYWYYDIYETKNICFKIT